MIKKGFNTSFFLILFMSGIVLMYTHSCSGSSRDLSIHKNDQDSSKHKSPPVLKPIEGFTLYENSDYGIRLQYPEEWDKIDEKGGVAFIIPDHDRDTASYEGFNLLFEPMRGIKMSLKKYKAITIDGMKKYMSGFELIESEMSTLDGYPAFQMVYNGDHKSMKMRFFSLFTILNGNLYIITFNTHPEAFNSYQDVLKKIITSFQFLF